MTGAELKEIRKKSGLSQGEMAEKLELKQSTYSNYENEIRKIPRQIEIKISLFAFSSSEYSKNLSETAEKLNNEIKEARDKKNYLWEVRNRVEEACAYLKIPTEEYSEYLGLYKDEKGDWSYNDQNEPSVKSITLFSEKYKINYNWLFSGKGNMFQNGTEDNLAKIDIINLKPGMGSGTETFEIFKIGDFIIEKSYLYPYLPDQVKAIFVHGDSMTPTLHNGDVVLYSPGLIRDNGIYILDVFGNMKCKRIEFKLDGSFLVISDNQRYESETVKPEENQTVRVCGKVIGWFHLHRD